MAEEFGLNFKISVDGKDELASFFRDNEQKAKSFQSTMTSALRGIGDDMKKFSVSAAKSLSSIAGFNLSVSGQAKGVLEFRDSVNKLATMAGIAEKDVDGLRRQITATAAATGQMKEDVTEALDAFVARTGDIQTGQKNLELYAKAATATGASMKEIALIGAELSDKLRITDQAKAFGILAAQAGAGSIEVKDMARQAPRYLNAAAQAGLTGEKGLREYGALAQIYAKGRSGPGAAATVATEIERTLDDVVKNRAKLEKLGITARGRDPVEVIQDIIRRTGGDMNALDDLGLKFGVISRRGIAQLAKDYNDSGHRGFTTFNKFMNIDANDQTINERAARNMASGMGRLRQWRARAEQFIDNGVDFATDHPYAVGALGLGALVGKQFLPRGLGGGGGITGAVGNLLGKGDGARVFVTNWPAGMGGGNTVADAAKTAAKVLGVSTVGTLASVAALTGGVMLVAHQQSKQTEETIKKYNEAHPVDPEAAKFFGNDYARATKAVMRRGSMQIVDAEHPIDEIKVKVEMDDQGTRSGAAIARRGGAQR